MRAIKSDAIISLLVLRLQLDERMCHKVQTIALINSAGAAFREENVVPNDAFHVTRNDVGPCSAKVHAEIKIPTHWDFEFLKLMVSWHDMQVGGSEVGHRPKADGPFLWYLGESPSTGVRIDSVPDDDCG